MDRDFLLQWEPVSGSAPTAALFTEEVEGIHYGLLMLLPPSPRRAATAIPREIVFVVDTSGSMGGVSIRQARESLDQALRQLRPQDRFNIIAFNSNYRALYRQPVAATPHHVQRATEFVRHLSASGGTEMMPALLAALQDQGEPDQLQEQPALRQVIFITDGAVGNEAALFEQISAQLGRNRLFTVGIGSAPNSWFMSKAAQFGRGGSDTGAFFASMAENEAKHGKEILSRRKAKFGDVAPRVTLSDLFDVEAPEVGAPRRSMRSCRRMSSR